MSLVEESVDFVIEILSRSLCLTQGLLSTFRAIVTTIIAVALTFMLLLNLFATAYTVTHESFLDIFCVKKPPIARNRVCASWDALQKNRSVALLDQVDLIPAFKTYLHIEDEDQTFSWALPFWLNQYESGIRGYRASLPQSNFPTHDLDLFHEEFSAYV